VVSQTVKH